MDQLKEILRQAIKYRFWIAVGLSALLPLIGFFVGSGKVKGEATAKKTEIEGADKGVKEYMSGTVPTAQWTDTVKKKTEVMSTDVNSAWRKLYERQAPLLQWPKDPPEIEEKFNSWGKKWPEGVDAVAVQIIIDRYINVYGSEVDKVYEICRPWKAEDGTGVVVVPPKEVLLQPFPFDPNNPPSDLGKIWGAQEKLWVQGALLEVVDRVNKNAKDWDSAVIKQINDLQVANILALDQIALAKGDTLKPAPEITAGGGSGAAPAAAPPPDAGGGAGMTPGAAGGFASSGMSGMSGMGGMGGAEALTVSYLGSSTEQYQIVPVSMSILIDQNSINNFLVELANSPMAIRVMDYEQNRPTARVVRPEKGQTNDFGFGMYSGGGMPGGAADMMFNARMGGSRMMMPGSGGMSDAPAMAGGYYGGGRAPRETAHGTDLRQRDMAKEKEEKKKAREAVKVQIHDPYYNIVEVRVYGQARFYNAPPAEQPAPESPGATAAADAGAATPAPADGNAPAPAATEPPKDDAAAPKTDEAKPADAGAAAPKEEAPKQEAPKSEAPKEEAPKDKDAASKDDAAKKEPEKTEAPKQDAPAPATPKANEPAPAPAPKA